MKSKRSFKISILFLMLTAFLFGCTLEAPGPSPSGAEYAYMHAINCYNNLPKAPQKKSLKSWYKCISLFENVYLTYPTSYEAPAARYMAGIIHYRIYKTIKKKKELQSTIKEYRAIVRDYPFDPICEQALFELGRIYETQGKKRDAINAYKKLLSLFPHGKKSKKAKERLNRLVTSSSNYNSHTKIKIVKTASRPSIVLKNIRHWSSKDYTRVVADLTGPVRYRWGLLPENKKLGLPPRLFIDLENTILQVKESQFPLPKNRLLLRIRIAQHDANTVRMVLDLKSLGKHKIFSLRDPSRVVIDIFAKKPHLIETHKKPPLKHKKGPLPSSLTRQLGLTISKVVIDPGHGGKDNGALGLYGLKEKDITLLLAKGLAKYLQKKGNIEVKLTRTRDVFLSLEERTAKANAWKADLFISIHVNAHTNRYVSGVETYYLNLATDEEAIRVAARENAMSSKNMGQLKELLKEIINQHRVNESRMLARIVQRELIHQLRRRYHRIKDLGVKKAPFYVLLGSDVPSILIEVSFITNPIDARRLRDKNYRKTLIAGMGNGIYKYIQIVNEGKISPVNKSVAKKTH